MTIITAGAENNALPLCRRDIDIKRFLPVPQRDP
jgi:hypothetical protein